MSRLRAAYLRSVCPRSIKFSLPFSLPRRHARDKLSQALSRFSVLLATKSWAGPGNEARSNQLRTRKLYRSLSWPLLTIRIIISGYIPHIKRQLLTVSPVHTIDQHTTLHLLPAEDPQRTLLSVVLILQAR